MIIQILNVDDPDWLCGELNGAVGLVPENYVTYNLPMWVQYRTLFACQLNS